MGYSIQKYHGSYNIVRRGSNAVKYIAVHYVGSGTSKAGSARNNCIYFAGGNRNASAHYFVDDGSIYEYADPRAYYTWHVGDGHGKYGITNANSIGIEVCISGNKPYTESEIDRLTWLVQKLQKDFGVPDSRVVRHYDASRKLCPYYYTPSGKGGSAGWKKLHARVTGGKVTGGATGKPTTASKPKWQTAYGDPEWFGPKMAKAWQQQLGTVADGVISGQPTSNKTYFWAVSGGVTYGSSGSDAVLELQKGLKAAGYDPNGLDRYYGRGCIKAHQRWLKKLGYYTGDIDGYHGCQTNVAVCKALAAGAYKKL